RFPHLPHRATLAPPAARRPPPAARLPPPAGPSPSLFVQCLCEKHTSATGIPPHRLVQCTEEQRVDAG
ncbi:hypothetical protein ABZP36_017036, partial [Zizania latifolia]